METDPKILLLSYADMEYDGRLRELRKALAMLGALTCHTRNSGPENEGDITFCGSYGRFILSACRFALQHKDIYALVLDNRKACIPGIIIGLLRRPPKIVQDCRELYVPSETKGLVSKLGCFFEKCSARRADVIICAGEERADLMCELWKLKQRPIVYENLRRLEYEGDGAFLEAKAKIDPLLIDGERRIVSTAGCDVSRLTDVLVKAMAKVGDAARLYLVGEGNPEDETQIRDLVAQLGLKNVSIIGRLNQSELKYLLSQSHIGIVSYHQRDTNNRFCASGKLYEYIYEGLPVVTTTNPPLKRLCEEYDIGVSDDSFLGGLVSILENYDHYVNNAKAFASMHQVDENNTRLAERLRLLLRIPPAQEEG